MINQRNNDGETGKPTKGTLVARNCDIGTAQQEDGEVNAG